MRLLSKEILIKVVKALIVDIDKERGLSEESLRRFFSIYLFEHAR
jgi:hypothetical protein